MSKKIYGSLLAAIKCSKGQIIEGAEAIAAAQEKFMQEASHHDYKWWEEHQFLIFSNPKGDIIAIQTEGEVPQPELALFVTEWVPVATPFKDVQQLEATAHSAVKLFNTEVAKCEAPYFALRSLGNSNDLVWSFSEGKFEILTGHKTYKGNSPDVHAPSAELKSALGLLHDATIWTRKLAGDEWIKRPSLPVDEALASEYEYYAAASMLSERYCTENLGNDELFANLDNRRLRFEFLMQNGNRNLAFREYQLLIKAVKALNEKLK